MVRDVDSGATHRLRARDVRPPAPGAGAAGTLSDTQNLKNVWQTGTWVLYQSPTLGENVESIVVSHNDPAMSHNVHNLNTKQGADNGRIRLRVYPRWEELPGFLRDGRAG